MNIPNNTTLFEREEAKDMNEDVLRRVDREQTVLAILCCGKLPMRISYTDRQLTFWFKREEADYIQTQLLSNEPFPVDFHKLKNAQDVWKDALIKMKTHKYEMVVA